MNPIDRALAFVAPQWALRRHVARLRTEMLVRHYEAAGAGRRTSGWRKPIGDANVIDAPALQSLRANARDLVRNNPHAKRGRSVIANHVVGWGIEAKPNPPNPQAAAVWKEWADSTACDADGRHNFAGLQKLVMRTVVESGECLIRRRIRRPGDVDAKGRALPLPLQIQVLEPDYIDTLKIGPRLLGAQTVPGEVVNGVEFDAVGRRVAYWLFPRHPGSELGGAQDSRPVPAEGVLHVYDHTRPGQVRGPSWFAAVILKMKDWDEYDDAQLMKQKIAALLAGIITDAGGGGSTSTIVGNLESGADFPHLEPGGLVQAPPGTDVKFTDPPRTSEFKDYAEVTLRAIAAGLGVPYEELTGDYSGVNFSSARMSRLAHYEDVHDWRWMMLIPQFCDPVWAWVMEAAAIMGRLGAETPGALWTAPPIPMIEPDKEGLAYQRNVRTGIMSLSEALRERGYDPEEVLKELAADFKKLDDLGLILDCDPRKVSQAGLTQARPAGTVFQDPNAVADGTEQPKEPEETPEEMPDEEMPEEMTAKPSRARRRRR